MVANIAPTTGPPTKIQILISWFHPFVIQSKRVRLRAAAGFNKLELEVIVYLY